MSLLNPLTLHPVQNSNQTTTAQRRPSHRPSCTGGYEFQVDVLVFVRAAATAAAASYSNNEESCRWRQVCLTWCANDSHSWDQSSPPTRIREEAIQSCLVCTLGKLVLHTDEKQLSLWNALPNGFLERENWELVKLPREAWIATRGSC